MDGEILEMIGKTVYDGLKEKGYTDEQIEQKIIEIYKTIIKTAKEKENE